MFQIVFALNEPAERKQRRKCIVHLYTSATSTAIHGLLGSIESV